jgi:hypothetical protein
MGALPGTTADRPCIGTVRALLNPLPTSRPAPLLYLDQNYLSGIAKRKPAFLELEPVLREAVARGAVGVPESRMHHLESAPRPDLGLLSLLASLSGGLRLPEPPGARERSIELRLLALIDAFPGRRRRPGDLLDVRALAAALPRCRLVACDAFMADLVRRAGLDVRYRCELFGGRRADVERLTARLAGLPPETAAPYAAPSASSV